MDAPLEFFEAEEPETQGFFAGGDGRIEAVVKYHGDLGALAASVGASAEDLGQGYAILTLPRENYGALIRAAQVEDVEPPKELFISDASAQRASCVPEVREDYGLSGKGVIVGVIDTGVDYAHPEFMTGEGRSRIALMWDQQAGGDPPAGYAFGREYTAADFDAALSSPDPYAVIPPTDTAGHGTAVCGIAAGNSGVAPGAGIMAVRVRSGGTRRGSPTTDIMRGLKFLTDAARREDLPLCVNISFGMNDGSHRGDSLFETYITDISSTWKCSITVPTGNEGSSGRHFSGRISPDEQTEIAFFTGAGLSRLYLSLWKDFADEFTVELIAPGGRSVGPVGEGTAYAQIGGTEIAVVYGAPTRYSVRQEVYFDLRDPAALIPEGVWTLRLSASQAPNGAFDVWLPTSGEAGPGTYFAGAETEGSMTIPSTAEKVISVAGYDSRLGSPASFSGVGNSSQGLPMPDLAAPAVDILAPRAGGGYDAFTGTSFAAPFVCGSAALLMEWGITRGNSPFLYGERLRALLRAGARRSRPTGWPDPRSGYGRLCVGETMERAREEK